MMKKILFTFGLPISAYLFLADIKFSRDMLLIGCFVSHDFFTTARIHKLIIFTLLILIFFTVSVYALDTPPSGGKTWRRPKADFVLSMDQRKEVL